MKLAKRFVKLEPGDLFEEVYCGGNWRQYETFDFPQNRWISLEESDWAIISHWCNPYPYPVSFETSMRDAVKDLPDDSIIVYCESNETFGVVRKRND